MSVGKYFLIGKFLKNMNMIFKVDAYICISTKIVNKLDIFVFSISKCNAFASAFQIHIFCNIYLTIHFITARSFFF